MNFKKLKLGSYVFDTNEILNGNDVHNERVKLLRTVYNEYVNVRLLLKGEACSKARLSDVKDELENNNVSRETIKRQANLTDDQLTHILYIAEHYIGMVK